MPLLASPEVAPEAEVPPRAPPNRLVVPGAVVVAVGGLLVGVPNNPVVGAALVEAVGACDVCPVLPAAPPPRLVLENSDGLGGFSVVLDPVAGGWPPSAAPNKLLVFGCSDGACGVSGFFPRLANMLEVDVVAAGAAELLAAVLEALPKRPEVAVVAAGAPELLAVLLFPRLAKRLGALAGCCWEEPVCCPAG